MKTDPTFLKIKLLSRIIKFANEKPIEVNQFENLAAYLVNSEIIEETSKAKSEKLQYIFLNALKNHPAYLHPNSRKRKEVYLRKCFAFCCSKILNLNVYQIADSIGKDRTSIIIILKEFKENLKFNRMLLNYFRGYLASLLIEIGTLQIVSVETVFENLIEAKGVDEVLAIVPEISELIDQIKEEIPTC